MNARCFACGTSFTANSGREDNSLRARRHTFRTPLRRSQLHCSPTHEPTSGAVSLADKGESVKAASPPLWKGSFHWQLNALPHTPEASSPDKFPFRRLSFHCVAGASNTFRAMPTQRPTHIDSTPTPDPDIRTAEALTPFRLSVNLSNYSEQPTAHGTEGSDIVAVQAQQQSPVAPQVTRHPSVQFAPSAFRSIDPAPPLRATSSSPHIATLNPEIGRAVLS